MRRFFPTAAFIVISATCVFSQNEPSKPLSRPDDNDVVKISTNLIQIDVTVTDIKGRIIPDIRPDEIEIFENGQKQKISNFSFVSAKKSVTEKPDAAQTDKISIPIPQATLRPEQIRRTISLVVDDLSLSFESVYYTRRALKKYVDDQMQDGDLVAIIRTGAGIGALQQFTSDKRVLYAAIERVKWNPQGSGAMGSFAPLEATPLETLKAAGDKTITAQDLADEKNRLEGYKDFRNSVFATGTLGALKYIVSGMGQLPGRKSVILFSDGFRLFERDEMGMLQTGRILTFLRELVDEANRSSVVFYTVDTRGLQPNSLTAMDKVVSPRDLGPELSGRSAQIDDLRDGPRFLSENTGGFLVINSNDLSGGVRRVLDDQSYYLVGYDPDADTFDAAKRKFNDLEVKVARKGATVRYRSGFFNVEEKPAAAKISSTATPVQQLATALTSPFAVGDIDLRLNALFGSDAKAGSYVRSLLHINAGDLKFTDEKDGVKKAVFEVMAISFGDNGQPIDQLVKSYTVTAKSEAYNRLITDGILYTFYFPVKKPGAYQYRVAIRDATGGQLGSASQFIEVPNVRKGRLTTSSIGIEALTPDQWSKISDPGSVIVSDAIADTALRQVKTGMVLSYGYEVYNARSGPAKQPSLKTKIRIFRDGQLILDGKETSFDPTGQSDVQLLKASGAFAIGKDMMAGDYILQIVVTDELAKPKDRIATQFVQFEVVE